MPSLKITYAGSIHLTAQDIDTPCHQMPYTSPEQLAVIAEEEANTDHLSKDSAKKVLAYASSTLGGHCSRDYFEEADKEARKLYGSAAQTGIGIAFCDIECNGIKLRGVFGAYEWIDIPASQEHSGTATETWIISSFPSIGNTIVNAERWHQNCSPLWRSCREKHENRYSPPLSNKCLP